MSKIDFTELGTEYAKLILAEEYGIDLYGDDLEINPARVREISDIFHNNGNFTLTQYVENILEEAKDLGLLNK